MISFFLFLASFAFYLRGASPCLDGGDSGEFIASSFSLGVPHAPGYPLFQLLGKSFQFVIPFASVSYRCHALSAVIAAFTLVLFFHFLKASLNTMNSGPAFLATLFLATRPLYIEQARVFEVFTLNGFFFLAVLYALLKAQREGAAWMLLAAFLFGLGMGNHQTLLVVAPLLMLYAVIPAKAGIQASNLSLNGRFTTWIPAFAGMTFCLLGLTIYAYLPLRAHASPPVNFGDPETWARFWAVITRKEFGMGSLHPAALPFRTATTLLEQSRQFLIQMNQQIGWVGFGLALAGAFIALRRPDRRIAGLLMLAFWLGLGWGFDLLSNLSPTSDIGQWRLERFLLVPLIAASVLLALAFEVLFRRPGESRGPGLLLMSKAWIPAFAGMTIAVFCLVESVVVLSRNSNFRWNLAFRDFALSTLRSAPRDSRVVIDRVMFDEPTSSLLVTTVVERKRPDVKFLYRPGTLFEMVYGKDILDLNWDERMRRQKEVEAHLLEGASTPVRALAFEKGNTPFHDPKLEGLLYAERSLGDRSELLLQRSFFGDYPSRLISIHFPYFMGKAALERGDIAAAKRWFNVAVQHGAGMAWLSSNIGGIYAQHNLLSEAQAAFAQAVALDPYFPNAQYGFGYVNYRLGNSTLMRQAWEKYLALEPRGKMAAAVREQLEEKLWK